MIETNRPEAINPLLQEDRLNNPEPPLELSRCQSIAQKIIQSLTNNGHNRLAAGMVSSLSNRSFAILAAYNTDTPRQYLFQGANNQTLINTVNKNDIQSVRRLIQAEVDLDAQDGGGFTALMRSIYHQNPVATQLLIEAGANVNLVTNTGETALMIAALKNQRESVRLLIENEASVDQRSNNNCTALGAAAFDGYTEIVKLLIQAKANLNLRGPLRLTALHQALYNNHLDVARVLINHGADTSIPNHCRLKRTLEENLRNVLRQMDDERFQFLRGMSETGPALNNLNVFSRNSRLSHDKYLSGEIFSYLGPSTIQHGQEKVPLREAIRRLDANMGA